VEGKLLDFETVKEILAVSEREKNRLRQVTEGQCPERVLEMVDVMGWRDILKKQIALTLKEKTSG